MSLLDGLKDALINPLYTAVVEADADEDFEFETALEAVIDGHIQLDQNDIDAILDDENPDNVVADMTVNDEKPANIIKDFEEAEIVEEQVIEEGDDLKSLEAALDELLAMDSAIDNADADEDPESTEGCTQKACETDEPDEQVEEIEPETTEGCNKDACESDEKPEEELDEDEDDEPEEIEQLSFDSLLKLVFNE